MDGGRAFKNPFPEFDGSGVPTLDKDDKLQGDYQRHVLLAIERLLKVLNQNTENDCKDFSVYTGSAGQALLYLHLHNSLPAVQDNKHLQKALALLTPCLSRLKGVKYSFLCGDPGPLAVAAVAFDKLGDKTKSKEFVARVESFCDAVCNDASLPDEVLYGRSGYLSALLFLQHYLGQACIQGQTVIKVVEAVLASGQKLAKRDRCKHPLMYEWHEKPYLGAAHGLAGIYFMLLQVKEPTLQEQIRQLIRPCIDYMMTLRFASGNCPSSLGSVGQDKLVHWCHGAPGWAPLFVQGYKIYKDKRYIEAAKQCAEVVWQRGLLQKGYGLCHGTAGNAYTFISLYKLTGNEKYLYYAYKFAEWCFDYGQHGCHNADTPYSLFEGMAGTIYFLVDMLSPTKAAFPTFEFDS
ncbi:unnamed protein product [Lymnaea stagnalis]|uniref:LanC-like protein 2 n=1 Tax=Lymnaea stagnalis TaxID=6523 RepID=A0AAV2I5Q1_LYMST